jgi:uncharacterized protein (DUF2252 family)
LREKTPRESQARWRPGADRADPVSILITQSQDRIPELLPIRYERMAPDPFAFLRGAAAIMAADLATTPSTASRVQSSGDAHIANFGAYASPEGTPVFDLNDFDETLPAPFEWDVKRLATSLVVAARVDSETEKAARRLARMAARAYREHMAQLAVLPPLAAWNSRIDLTGAIADIDSLRLRSSMEARLAKTLRSAARHFDLVGKPAAAPRIAEKPPFIFHLDRHALPAARALASYAESLEAERQVLLRRFALRDVAFKVVGVGSVGTFCAIGLLTAGDGAPLLLQIKEAQESVLAPWVGPSAFTNHGERVVVGQRMMQAQSDIFLGWTRAPIGGRHFYIRGLKDSRLADLGVRLQGSLPFYAMLCGRTLARAHARAGDAALISGYLGQSTVFDEAISEFAVAYADQTHADWKSFRAAIKTGRLPVATPPTKPH